MKKKLLVLTSGVAVYSATVFSQKIQKPDHKKPNIVFVLTDNLAYGELGCYGGGFLRGAATPRIDQLATEGLRLTNFCNEPMSTPSRSSLLTGRFAIRSGTYVVNSSRDYGLVQWERTTAELLSDAGYATALYGKWHLGNKDGRFPIDQGFDEYYGIPNTSDEAFPNRRARKNEEGYYRAVLEGRKGEKVHVVKTYDLEARREIDDEITNKTIDFINRNAASKKPFYAFVSLTQVHFPTIPSRKFEGKTGNGDWADALLQTDTYVGALLDAIKKLNIQDNTIFIFTSDNGAEDIYPWRGWAGPWAGSYFTAMEGGLRCPFIIWWPGKVPENKVSNEIVHGVDVFTTLAKITGTQIPQDRFIDGIDQSDFLLGKQATSNREWFPIYVGKNLNAVKYKNWKIHYAWQEFMRDTAIQLPNPIVFNLYKNPQEHRELKPSRYSRFYPSDEEQKKEQAEDSVVLKQVEPLIKAHLKTLEQYPPIPLFTPEPYVPANNTKHE